MVDEMGKFFSSHCNIAHLIDEYIDLYIKVGEAHQFRYKMKTLADQFRAASARYSEVKGCMIGILNELKELEEKQ